MATHRMSILGPQTMPDGVGNVFPEPYPIKATNDVWGHNTWIFLDTSVRDRLYGVFKVPKTYIGSPKVVIIWSTTATTGNARWETDYRAVAAGESLDQSGTQESVGATEAAPGTAHFQKETSLSLTAGNLAVDDLVEYLIARDGAEAGPADTIAAALAVHDVLFEWADA